MKEMESGKRSKSCGGTAAGKEILGVVATGRAVLGFFPTIRVHKASGKERHQLLQSEIHRSEEEKRVKNGRDETTGCVD